MILRDLITAIDKIKRLAGILSVFFGIFYAGFVNFEPLLIFLAI